MNSSNPEVRWVSCSQELDWATSRYSHVLIEGRHTTLCGATGTHPDVWRTSNIKPRCLKCTIELSEMLEISA